MIDPTRAPGHRLAYPDACGVHGTVSARAGSTALAVEEPGEPPDGRGEPGASRSSVLDGRVPMAIYYGRLQALRDVATRSDSPLADILLAVFGLVLDRHVGHKDAAITILPTGRPTFRRRTEQRGMGRAEAGQGDAMPLDMRLAIARAAGAASRSHQQCRGVAFRHVRYGIGRDRIVAEPPAPQSAERAGACDFDLVLDHLEFDDMVLVECVFRTQVAGIDAVERLLHDYAHALQSVAASVGREQ